MNCLNCSRYLKESIDSVFAQTFTDWEIVFWDNGSTDNSIEIASGYGDKVKVFCGEETVPLGAARNLAIEQAKGEFIAFLDCDDIWLPEKLEKQIRLFDNHKVGLVFCDTYYFNENGIFRQRYEKEKPLRGRVFQQLLTGYFLSMETVIIRRIALDSLREWFDVKFNLIEEADLFIRIAHDWELDFVDEPLAKWRVHQGSWTYTKTALFPVEKQMQIDKYIALYPDFEKEYSPEIYLMRAGLEYRLAVDELREGKRISARRRIRQFKNIRRVYLIIYIFTFIPSFLYRLVRKSVRIIRPDSNI